MQERYELPFIVDYTVTCGARDVTDEARKQVFGVVGVFPHEKFNFKTAHNDIALLKVDR